MEAKHGCCVDKTCTPETCMQLPDGKTCMWCAHLTRCIGLFGCKPENTACDFFPRRYAEPTPAESKDVRIAALEAALAAAREKYQKQVAHVAAMFAELKNLAVEAGWDANEDLASPMQFVRQFVRQGLVPQAGRMKEEMADLRVELAAARAENERLRAPRLIQAAPDVVFEEYEDPHTGELLYRQKSSAELAALRSRADDAERVERVKHTIRRAFLGSASMVHNDEAMDRVARAVLAAAEGREP